MSLFVGMFVKDKASFWRSSSEKRRLGKVMSGENKNFFLEFLGIGNPLFLLFNTFSNMGHNRRVDKLQKEAWFDELLKDYRYGFIIKKNNEIRSFLAQSGNIELLKTDEQVRKEFIDLVMSQHMKYVGNEKEKI